MSSERYWEKSSEITMNKKLSCLALVAVTCAVATAQVVQVQDHENASDIWGPYFNANKKMTFTGRVTGIVKGKPAARADEQVAAIVRTPNGGSYEVEIGPSWFVKDQTAKLHVGDKVQVTGSKLLIDKHGVIVASQILIRGAGGPVLALRRLSGKAFWMPTAVASTEPTAEKTATDTGSSADTTVETTNVIPNPPSMLSFDNGTLNVDTNTYNGYYDSVNRPTPYMQVVSGAYPFFLYPRGPFWY
jgi:hypothetical protein